MPKRFFTDRLSLTLPLFVFVVFFILLLTGVFPTVSDRARWLFSGLLAPVYNTATKAQKWLGKNRDVEMLQRENEHLREENTQLKIDKANLEQAKSENESLRKLLDFFEKEGDDLPRVLGRVIGKDPENRSLIVLNIGERDGIRLNFPVVTEEGIFVAKIIETSFYTSRALLLTDAQSRAASVIRSGSPLNKIVRGDRSLGLILEQVPQQENLIVGQLVVSSGLESTVPPGLLIGEISELISQPNDLFQQAVLKPLADFESLNFVSVIVSSSS